MLVMLPDVQKCLEELEKDIKPFADALMQNPPSLNGKPLSETGKSFADSTVQVKLSYCMLLLNYLILKAEHADTKNHPLTTSLVRSRQEMEGGVTE